MKIGFIGCGNMGGAMMRGILDSGKCRPEDMMASDASKAMLDMREKELGICVSSDNCETAGFCRRAVPGCEAPSTIMT